MSEEIDIAKQWLAKARNDLLNARCSKPGLTMA